MTNEDFKHGVLKLVLSGSECIAMNFGEQYMEDAMYIDDRFHLFDERNRRWIITNTLDTLIAKYDVDRVKSMRKISIPSGS